MGCCARGTCLSRPAEVVHLLWGVLRLPLGKVGNLFLSQAASAAKKKPILGGLTADHVLAFSLSGHPVFLPRKSRGPDRGPRGVGPAVHREYTHPNPIRYFPPCIPPGVGGDLLTERKPKTDYVVAFR